MKVTGGVGLGCWQHRSMSLLLSEGKSFVSFTLVKSSFQNIVETAFMVEVKVAPY